MKRIATVKNGVCRTIINQPDEYAPASNEVDVSALRVGPGYLYDGSSFTAPDKVFQSRLDFRRYAKDVLGAGALVTIEESFAGHASADIRYAYKEFQDAEAFTKDKVDEFLTAGVAASCLTSNQKDAVIENWPT